MIAKTIAAIAIAIGAAGIAAAPAIADDRPIEISKHTTTDGCSQAKSDYLRENPGANASCHLTHPDGMITLFLNYPA
ncbi:hypothetical protein ACWFRF_33205 [Nocardia sp. NPDC055165]|uniref:hypothetical protein n=1 Tax=Nocardia sp. NPDC060220 TaxID=3347076 RepID=UPI0036498D08